MDISLIGANAGSVWNALHENGELDLTKLKKETKLSETEIHTKKNNPLLSCELFFFLEIHSFYQ